MRGIEREGLTRMDREKDNDLLHAIVDVETIDSVVTSSVVEPSPVVDSVGAPDIS